MTYEEYITKHNLHLDLTWKGFEVKDAGKAGNAWPCFKWQYHVTVGNNRIALVGDYTQGIGHGKFEPELKAPNLGTLEYDSKIGLHFKLRSGGTCKLVRPGMESRVVDNTDFSVNKYPRKVEWYRPWFEFERLDTATIYGPKFYVTRPTFADILDSLRTDAECAYPTFEEFAAELGYDPDSRSAEKIYLACCEIERKLRGLVGGKGMVELLEEVERL